jgi:hypothetical protein
VAPDIVRPEQKRDATKHHPVRKLGEIDPQELFIEAFNDQYGCDPDKEYLDCFSQLLHEVER